MKYTKCKFYKLKSKKQLRDWLGIDNSSFFRKSNLEKNIFPKISIENNHQRLVEVSSAALKFVQTRILHILSRLDCPDYLYSGVKGKSHISNAKQHQGNMFMYKLDISKFFPNIRREFIYLFFRDKLQVSSDVAEILTNCTTTNLLTATYRKPETKNAVMNFMEANNLQHLSHLSTGSPTSMLLAYLANIPMFEKIESIAKETNLIFTVYADDIVFSSKQNIPYKVRYKIVNIIESYGYSVSRKKCKYLMPRSPKTVTGVVINSNGIPTTPNRLILKAHQKILQYKKVNLSITDWQSLRGTISVANQIENKFPHLLHKMGKDILDDKTHTYIKHE